MSGKYNNQSSRKKRAYGIGILLLVLLLALVAAVVFLLRPDVAASLFGTEGITEQAPDATPSQAVSAPADPSAAEGPVQLETVEEVRIDLGNGLVIADIGSYTGMYMEDGTDEIVSGVLMMVVTNNADAPLQYAEISLPVGGETASFALSTLPVGESVVVLEQKRMPYDKNMDYTNATAQNVVWFTEALSLCEDRIQIQSLDGALNITNISGADIDGEIIIYYKNSSADMLYGGITYRVRIAEGLAAGEIKQIISDHYSSGGSTIMFVTCG